MRVDVGRWRRWHFVFVVGVRKSSMVVTVVVMVIDRPKVAVIGGVALTEHVRCHKVWWLRVQRVSGLGRRCLIVGRCEARQAQIVFCNGREKHKECQNFSLVRKTYKQSEVCQHVLSIAARWWLHARCVVKSHERNFMAFNIAINYSSEAGIMCCTISAKKSSSSDWKVLTNMRVTTGSAIINAGDATFRARFSTHESSWRGLFADHTMSDLIYVRH